MSQGFVVTGLAGSLRAGSYAQALLRELAALLPAGAAFQALDIGALPHYNQDEDGDPPPAAVAAARARIAASHAVLLVTPEFNHGLPGVLKNTLDWLSRPAFASCFAGKPVLFATHSPGALGGVRAQAQLRETLASMLCQLVPLPEIAVTYVDRKLDAAGRLTDAPTRRLLAESMERFLAALPPR